MQYPHICYAYTYIDVYIERVTYDCIGMRIRIYPYTKRIEG